MRNRILIIQTTEPSVYYPRGGVRDFHSNRGLYTTSLIRGCRLDVRKKLIYFQSVKTIYIPSGSSFLDTFFLRKSVVPLPSWFIFPQYRSMEHFGDNPRRCCVCEWNTPILIEWRKFFIQEKAFQDNPVFKNNMT